MVGQFFIPEREEKIVHKTLEYQTLLSRLSLLPYLPLSSKGKAGMGFCSVP